MMPPEGPVRFLRKPVANLHSQFDDGDDNEGNVEYLRTHFESSKNDAFIAGRRYVSRDDLQRHAAVRRVVTSIAEFLRIRKLDRQAIFDFFIVSRVRCDSDIADVTDNIRSGTEPFAKTSMRMGSVEKVVFVEISLTERQHSDSEKFEKDEE